MERETSLTYKKKLKDNPAVIILAAGKSTRMGSPKFLLKYNANKCFLQKIIEDYTDWGVNEIIVVLNSDGYKLLKSMPLQLPPKINIVVNYKHETSRFYSIQTGLRAIKEATFAFIHNVDNPFVEKDVLDSLYKNKANGDFIVPFFNGKGGHPILINEKVIIELKQQNNNNLMLKEFLYKYHKFCVKITSGQVLVNINDMKDYKKYFTGL